MPNSYTCLSNHVIFSAKNRLPQIDATLCDRLYEYMGGIARDQKVRLIAAGGMPDHVHLLLSLHPTKALADVLREVKSGSSRWVHDTVRERRDFG